MTAGPTLRDRDSVGLGRAQVSDWELYFELLTNLFDFTDKESELIGFTTLMLRIFL